MHTSSTAVMVARLPAIKLADSALLPMHRGTCFSCLRWLLMSWQRARWRGCLEALEGAAHHVQLACVAISCRRHRGPRRRSHERRLWRSPRWAHRCPPCSEILFQSVWWTLMNVPLANKLMLDVVSHLGGAMKVKDDCIEHEDLCYELLSKSTTFAPPTFGPSRA